MIDKIGGNEMKPNTINDKIKVGCDYYVDGDEYRADYLKHRTRYDKLNISIQLPPLLFELIVGNNPNKKEIEFCEYPEYLSGNFIKLNKIKNLTETNETYTIKTCKIRTIKLYYTNASAKQKEKIYKVYKCGNEKYIKYENDDDHHKYLVKIVPIKWEVNYETQTIKTCNYITTKILETIITNNEPKLKNVRGSKTKTLEEIDRICNEIIKKANLRKTIKYTDYKNLLSIIESNNNFEDFRGFVELTFEGPSLNFEEKDYIKKILVDNEYKFAENTKHSKINNTINEIYDLFDLGIINDKKTIKSIVDKIDKLVSEYNQNLRDKTNNELYFSDGKLSYLEKQLEFDLNTLLNDLIDVNKYKEHIKMLKLMDRCLKILEDDNGFIATHELEKDILTIKRNILPYIKNKDKEKEINSIISNERKRLLSFIKGNNNNEAKNYKSFNIFIINFRKKLQDYIMSLKSATTRSCKRFSKNVSTNNSWSKS